MSKRNYAASVSPTEETIQALRGNRELAVEYLKAALAELNNPENRAAGLLALRDIVEAYGGIGAIAAVAGIRQESLYRMLSPKGNPTVENLVSRVQRSRNATVRRTGTSCSCLKTTTQV